MLLKKVYDRLLAFHGPQGWWPIYNPAAQAGEYHVRAPRDADDFYEIAIGAILTQNIAWKNVERAIAALKGRAILHPQGIGKTRRDSLARLIRPTGYYNQKAVKIKNFNDWYGRFDYDYSKLTEKDPAEVRGELLSINGIGPETADSILLYALNCKIFVIDAYTKRIFTRLGYFTGAENYADMQARFHERFDGSARDYNEYHALIVAHGKDFCKTKPRCGDCCLAPICKKKTE